MIISNTTVIIIHHQYNGRNKQNVKR